MHKFIFIFILFLTNSSLLLAQENCISFENRNLEKEQYNNCIRKHRTEYINEFIENPKSPIASKDTGYLAFFKPDVSWWLEAEFVLTPNEQATDFNTSSGKLKKYRQYALIKIVHEKDTFDLAVYQSESLKNTAGYENYLFLPFTDLTNSEESYGGGRYLDLRIDNFHGGHVFIDFNKAYNPYCAYSGGYSCPVPPLNNRLNIEIKAGEMNFNKPH